MSRRPDLALLVIVLGGASAMAQPPDAAPSGEPPTEQSTPAQSTPAQSTPAQSSPAQSTPPQSTPAQSGSQSELAVPEPPPAEPREPTVRVEWGQGVTFRSDDGAFTLEIRSRVQAQAAFESAPTGVADPTIEFLVRRARISLRGHLLSSDLQYYVQLGLAPRDMEADLLIPLRDAQIAWTGLRDLSIRVGQMKVPFNRERVISSSSLQLVDRSIVNAELTLDRDLGVQLYSNDLFGLGGVLGYQLGVFAGDGRLRINDGPGLLYVGRVQVQPFGEFEDGYSEADLTREERVRLSIGAGFAFNHQSRRARSTHGDFYQLAGFDYASFEADLIFKYAGFSLMAETIVREAVGTHARTGDVGGMPVTEQAQSGAGWMVQAGYLFSREVPIELAFRYAEIVPLGAVTSLAAQRELRGGVSWYPIGHDLKLQLDYGYVSPARFEDGFHQVRLQTQAYF